jgi:hypothetical protein
MDENVERKRAKRFEFMKAAYEGIHGDRSAIFSKFELGKTLRFEDLETMQIARYQTDEGLIKSLGGDAAHITHPGVREVEAALSAPDKPTDHFPPVNLIVIEQMTQSQIQQGTVGSSQSGKFSLNDIELIREFAQE